MADASGAPTTGLLRAIRFVKDNRLLPSGFDKATADADIAVRGDAERDPDFAAEGDRIRYVVELGAGAGPWHVETELRYQPISFRWAENLKQYGGTEPRRFVGYYESMSSSSSTVLARASVTVE